jgi:hypothetical protein
MNQNKLMKLLVGGTSLVVLGGVGLGVAGTGLQEKNTTATVDTQQQQKQDDQSLFGFDHRRDFHERDGWDDDNRGQMQSQMQQQGGMDQSQMQQMQQQGGGMRSNAS